MAESTRFRFGVFELDTATGELRRKGMRVRLHAQPFQVLALLVQRPGDMLTREELCRELWPEGTYVDYEHGVNSAINRLREALGDTAKSPRYVETIARRGYRFVASVERLAGQPSASDAARSSAREPPPPDPGVAGKTASEADNRSDGETTAASRAPVFKARWPDRFLAAPQDLPESSPRVVRTLFLLLQSMYMAFYIGALANLGEIEQLLSRLPHGPAAMLAVVVSAGLLLPVRLFLVCAVLFRAPGFADRFLALWPALLGADLLWSLAPFLLLHHIPFGLALACTAVLVYAPFAERSLVLMGAGRRAG